MFRGERITSTELRDGDVVLVEAGQRVPTAGRILEGVATLDEAAINGTSARVLREEHSDCCEVLAGALVVSGRLVVQVQRSAPAVVEWPPATQGDGATRSGGR